MVMLMEYQLRQAMTNVELSLRLVEKKRKESDSSVLENYSASLKHISVLIGDVLNDIDEVEDYL